MISRYSVPSLAIITFCLFLIFWLSGSNIAPQNGIWEIFNRMDWNVLFLLMLCCYLMSTVTACWILTRLFLHRKLIFAILFVLANTAAVFVIPAHFRDWIWFLIYDYGLAPICNGGKCAYLPELRRVAIPSSCAHLNPRASQYCLAAESENGPCMQALFYLPDKTNQQNREILYAEFLEKINDLDLEESNDIHLYSRADRTLLLFGMCANM